MPIARALAFVFACILLSNAAAVVVRPGSEWTVWLLDLRGMSPLWRGLILSCAGLAALVFAVRCPASVALRSLLAVVLLPILATAVVDAVRYASLLATERVYAGAIFPFSLAVAAGIGTVVCSTVRPRMKRQPLGVPVFLFTAAAVPALLPLGLMCTFGLSDYRRPADAAIVFGAKVYADGSVSDVVADRVHTACDLYRTGMVGCIVFSGGPGDGAIPEADAMREEAVRQGVPREACIVDYTGLNTRASLMNLRLLANGRGWRDVLAVSNSYHLPRIKLLADRLDLEVRTVPAQERYRYSGMPVWVARETVAWWAYLCGMPT